MTYQFSYWIAWKKNPLYIYEELKITESNFFVATEMRQNRNIKDLNQVIKPWLNFPSYCQHNVILTWKEQRQKNSECYFVDIGSRAPLPLILLSGLIISRKCALSKTPCKNNWLQVTTAHLCFADDFRESELVVCIL